MHETNHPIEDASWSGSGSGSSSARKYLPVAAVAIAGVVRSAGELARLALREGLVE